MGDNASANTLGLQQYITATDAAWQSCEWSVSTACCPRSCSVTVLRTAMSTQSSTDDEKDISDYLTGSEYSRLLHWLMTDNVTGLSELRRQRFADDDGSGSHSRSRWWSFLRSRDHRQRRCGSCDARQFSGHASQHGDSCQRGPSCPFLLAVFYGARKSLRFMLRTGGPELAAVTESGCNAMHVLCYAACVGALETPSVEDVLTGRCVCVSGDNFPDSKGVDDNASVAATQVTSGSFFVDFFIGRHFPPEQLAAWATETAASSHGGATPAELAVLLGRPDLAEILLYYCSPSFVRADGEHPPSQLGVHEQLTIPLGSYDCCAGEPPPGCRFFVSPLLLIGDAFRVTEPGDLQRLKATGVWRRDFIFARWLELMKRRNLTAVYVVIVYGLILFTAILIATTKSAQYLRATCANATATGENRNYELVAMAFLLCCMLSNLISVALILRFKLPRWRYLVTVGLEHWSTGPEPYSLLACGTSLSFLFVVLVPMLISPRSFCNLPGSFGQSLNSFVVICINGILFYTICLLLRLVPLVSNFTCSLVQCLNTFSTFMLYYVYMIFVFSQLLDSTELFASENGTVPYVSKSYYTFLVTLDVFDTGIFKPSAEKLPLVIIHFLLILLVPVFFLNFICGLLSMRLCVSSEHEPEYLAVVSIQILSILEYNMRQIRRLKWRLCGQIARSAEVALCLPVLRGSASAFACNLRRGAALPAWGESEL